MSSHLVFMLLIQLEQFSSCPKTPVLVLIHSLTVCVTLLLHPMTQIHMWHSKLANHNLNPLLNHDHNKATTWHSPRVVQRWPEFLPSKIVVAGHVARILGMVETLSWCQQHSDYLQCGRTSRIHLQLLLWPCGRIRLDDVYSRQSGESLKRWLQTCCLQVTM